MGKGDKRSKKGKITIGTYGKTRTHRDRNTASALHNPAAVADAKPAKAKKAPAKKKK